MHLRLLAYLLSLPLLAATDLPLDADEQELPAVDGMRRGWSVEGSSREAVRLFYRARFRAEPSRDFWNGNLSRCQSGETLPRHRRATLNRINWYRAMAGLPADIREDLAATPKAQAAALVAAANRRISHEVPTDWACATAETQEGAHLSAIALGVNGTQAVDEFMRDAGSQNIGANHRRWLLYPQTMSMGLGDVPGADPLQTASAFTAFDGMYGGNRPTLARDFVAWPPPGWVPYQVVFPRWSISLPKADYRAATVSMRRDGEPLPVRLEPSDDGAGESSLIWLPLEMADDAHWPKPARDTVYQISVAGIKQGETLRNYDYEVKVFDPDAAHPSRREATVIGPTRVALGGGQFGVLAQPGATGYQWRALKVSPWALHEGAETGFGLFVYAGTKEYLVLDQKIVASGQQAFRLAHTRGGDEILGLNEQLALGSRPWLVFRSRFGVAGADERALVELLVEGRDHWETIYAQQGSGQPKDAEPAFREQRLDLSAYADRLVRLRFRYAFPHGDYFSPDDGRVGWYLDDIRLEDALRLEASTEPARTRLGRFEFKPDRPGDWRLQSRPLVYRALGDWGPLWAVKTE